MTIDINNMLNSILESLSRVDYIPADDIPNIDLYMDQVTTLMEKELAATKRYEEDKILTKTMINNYAKNNLLPPPVKKKYSKEHVLVLILIYYFKNILSIRDIEHLLEPLTGRYFHTDHPIQIDDIYEEICSKEKNRVSHIQEDIADIAALSETMFQDAPDGDREKLQLFSFICSLSVDVYIKKLLVEKIIDQLYATEEHEKKPKKDKKKD